MNIDFYQDTVTNMVLSCDAQHFLFVFICFSFENSNIHAGVIAMYTTSLLSLDYKKC